MNCEKAKSLLGWFFDGELSASDRKLVAQHVERCLECTAELAALTELDRAGRELASPEPPADLWDRIAGRLIPHDASKTTQAQGLGRRRFMAAAAGFVAVVTGGVLAYRIVRRNSNAVNTGPSGDPLPSDLLGQRDPILANLALLGSEDRKLAESQRICAARGCDNRLGNGGRPVKIVLQDKPVFLCCEECERWARAHPAEAVAKLHTLELRIEDIKKKP